VTVDGETRKASSVRLDMVDVAKVRRCNHNAW
jgi:hypothetical protein